ncbi:MAG: universal stress protein [Mariprofundales bacterium]
MLKFSHILACTDFSPLGQKSLRAAWDIANKYNARMSVLHVLTAHPHYAEFFDIPLDINDVQFIQDMERISQERLQINIEDICGSIENINILVREEVGSTTETICNVTKEIDADLIVIASHGHTGLMHLLLSSVAEHVVQKSHSPVLVIKE